VKRERFWIKPWTRVPALNGVVKMLNIRKFRFATRRDRGSYASYCFSKQQGVVILTLRDDKPGSRRNERCCLEPTLKSSDVD